MRITGGRARGINLRTAQFEGFRPAMDATREALFSSLQSAGGVEGRRVLDLFAGSGAYGLEALSRGASAVTWVENHPAALACLEPNLAAVKRSHPDLANVRTAIVRSDVRRWSPPSAAFDLILCDPPYDQGISLMAPLWPALAAALHPEALGLIWEVPGRSVSTPPEGWVLRRELGGRKNRPTLLWLNPLPPHE